MHFDPFDYVDRDRPHILLGVETEHSVCFHVHPEDGGSNSSETSPTSRVLAAEASAERPGWYVTGWSCSSISSAHSLPPGEHHGLSCTEVASP